VVSGCELCKRERLTQWFHEDDICWVAICKTCGVPMIVLKRHTMEPTEEELRHLEEVVRRLFGDTARVRKTQRKIPDHLHWHIELSE